MTEQLYFTFYFTALYKERENAFPFIFLTWTIFEVFIEFVKILFLFYVLFFFGHEACGILVPQTGIKPTASALEGEVLTTESLGKPYISFLACWIVKSLVWEVLDLLQTSLHMSEVIFILS